MDFEAALVKEQGVTFAVVAVKPGVFASPASKKKAVEAFAPHFPGAPIILAREIGPGRLEYFGRPDIVKFLANLLPQQLPWKRYSLT